MIHDYQEEYRKLKKYLEGKGNNTLQLKIHVFQEAARKNFVIFQHEMWRIVCLMF
jgi:hypothetical protein